VSVLCQNCCASRPPHRLIFCIYRPWHLCLYCTSLPSPASSELFLVEPYSTRDFHFYRCRLSIFPLTFNGIISFSHNKIAFSHSFVRLKVWTSSLFSSWCFAFPLFFSTFIKIREAREMTRHRWLSLPMFSQICRSDLLSPHSSGFFFVHPTPRLSL